MKKIINWLFGSFFRTIGRIFAFLFISVAIMFIIYKLGFNPKNLLFMNVNASTTQNYNSTYTSIKLCTYPSASSCKWFGDYNLGVWNTPNDESYYLLSEWDIHVVGSNTNVFKADNTYFFEFTLGVTGGVYNSNINTMYGLLGNPEFLLKGSVNASESGATEETIKNFSCSTKPGNGTNRLIVSCSFTPKVDIKYFRVVLFYIKESKLYFDQYSYYSLDHFTFTEGLASSIDNQTNTIKNQTDKINDNINDVKDTIDNDDVSDAESSASDFFSNFNTNTHGLTGIITAPLNAIQSLTSKSCSPLVLPLPYVNENLTLPCMRTIYEEHFGSFIILYDIITLGIVSYWVMVRIFTLVKDFKNPDHDEIEVMDL